MSNYLRKAKRASLQNYGNKKTDEKICEKIEALKKLDFYKKRLIPQQYRTLRGQIKAGDIEEFNKGLKKCLVINQNIRRKA